MTTGQEVQESPRLMEVLKIYMAIMRPYLITMIGVGIAFGCWQAGNLPGTALFLALAAFPYALRIGFWALGRLRPSS